MQNENQQCSKIPYGNNKEKGKYQISNDAKIYYEVYGDGKPVVILHGGGLGCAYELGRIIDKLQITYKVIVISTRGHGHSETGIHQTWDQKAEDVLNIIQEITDEKIIIIGFSDGAYTSYYFASKYPKKIDKIIAIGAGTLKAGFFLNNFPLENIIKMDKLFYEQQLKLRPEPNKWQEDINNYMNYVNKTNVSENIFTKIQCEVLLIAGENDDHAPIDTVLEAYKMIPNKKLCIVPNSGHCCFIDNFDIVWSAIYNFLDFQYKEIKKDIVLQTSKSWDDNDLPDYFNCKPFIQVDKYIVPPKMRLPEHYHKHMSFGIIISGAITIVKKDGTEKIFKEGESFAETVNTFHYGINKGNFPVMMYVFNASKEGISLSFKPDS